MAPVAYLIGDSICAGYAPWVQKSLAGSIDVKVVPENAFDSRNILRHARRWLGEGHYDVIHFNCGLHDIKAYDGEPTQRVALGEYRRNLTDIAKRLNRRTDALLWATTTPVVGTPHKGGFTRSDQDVDAYNEAANQVMASLGVPINDLYSVVNSAGSARCVSADQVHMTEDGYRVLGERVADEIRSVVSPGPPL